MRADSGGKRRPPSARSRTEATSTAARPPVLPDMHHGATAARDAYPKMRPRRTPWLSQPRCWVPMAVTTTGLTRPCDGKTSPAAAIPAGSEAPFARPRGIFAGTSDFYSRVDPVGLLGGPTAGRGVGTERRSWRVRGRFRPRTLHDNPRAPDTRPLCRICPRWRGRVPAGRLTGG
jgi:hypothetical protein